MVRRPISDFRSDRHELLLLFRPSAVTSDTGDDEVYLDDDGVYGIGDKIEVTVTFSEDVTVTGSPQLELTVGSSAKNAAYKSTTDSKVVFSYAVASG